MYHEDRYIEAIYSDLKQLERMVRAQDGPVLPALLQALQDYHLTFTNYVLIQRKIGLTDDTGLQGEMQCAAQAIEPIVREIYVKVIKAGDHARQKFLVVLSIVWVVGLGLGGTFFYFHARSITHPIIQLKDAALKIGEGKLNTQIAIQSNDEVGTLAKALNQMVADLSKTQQSLR